MDKAHDVQGVTLSGTTMLLRVDGKAYTVDLAKESVRLARATQKQRGNFEVSPAGYGIHWPEIDEDLSIDGLIGAKHPRPSATTSKAGGLKDVNRSKRLVNLAPPEGGGYSRNMVSWSRRLSSCCCFWMYSRILASSRPTVET